MPSETRPGGDIDLLIFAGPSEMSARMRSVDWAQTCLGSPAGWSQSFRSALSICLGSRFPIALYWGPQLALVYNDAWSPILGDKHPWALGRPAREVWPEIWSAIGPLFEHVLQTGEGTYAEDSLLLMHRHGYTEACYFNFTFSPVRGESGALEGIFNAVNETTFRVVSERRTRALRELSESIITGRSAREVCALAVDTLGRAVDDVTFCAVYLTNPRTGALELAAGDDRTEPPDPTLVAAFGTGASAGKLILGCDPRRAIDDEYRLFAERAGSIVARALAAITALEAERERAEALAALDRQKTAFFSNVSHEFRTPLTLMLGPTEDALRSPDRALRGESLELVHRNQLRLLKLVNALLEFSRIEAGAARARLEPVDLAAVTADLAGSFRAAIERAGLRFEVDCPPLPVDVFVDPTFWETIVLNLLSNALKFTLEGTIRVELRWRDDRAHLTVTDTGAGIAAHELPRLFERFNRIDSVRARTHEGSGIGLALVDELTRLHGGQVSVASTLGEGTTFTVSIPHGAPPAADRSDPGEARVASTTVTAHVAEADRWLAPADDHDPGRTGDATVLIADDNADMREYLRRLLAPHWSVIVVADGAAALEAARRQPPDLVVSDVMMPGLDGLDLLAALRAEPRLAGVPVILLSARAGEEARLDGLDAGADDYLVKPFSARELVARVRLHLTQVAVRQRARAAEARLRSAIDAADAGTWWVDLATGLDTRDAALNRLLGLPAVESTQPVDDYLARVHPDDRDRVARGIADAIAARGRYEADVRIVQPDGAIRWLHDVGRVQCGPDGTPISMTGAVVDITDHQALAREQAQTQERLRAALSAAAIGTYVWNVRTDNVEHDEGVKRVFGFADGEGDPIEAYTARVHPDDRDRWLAGLAHSAREGVPFDQEYRLLLPDGAMRWVHDKGAIVRDVLGSPSHMVGAVVDITPVRTLVARVEESLATTERALASAHEANRSKDEFLAMLGHELRNPLAPILTALELMRLRGDAQTLRQQEVIERQARHLVRLVDDLLDVSRITRGMVTLQREPVDLAEVIAKALEMTTPLLEERRHDVSSQVPADGSLVVGGDAVRLAQVVANLMTNAARYTPPGGVLRVDARRDGETVLVRVTDNGAGIPAELLPRVFDLFVQGPRSADRSDGGLGIGLALVKNLVRLHGGEVAASSDGPGRGSEFVIRLPALAASAEPATGSAVEDQVPASGPGPAPVGRRILVVDDNADAGELLGELLRTLGHEVTVAESGPAALALFDAVDPDVAVLDIGLPEMDGYELAGHIRARAARRCLLIALTGYGQERDRERTQRAGFDLHLVKPVDAAALLAAIDGSPAPPHPRR